MGDFYRPYPNEVYRINELLPDKLDEGGVAFFIDTFDYTNRCVNYSFVAHQKRLFNEQFKAETILNFFDNGAEWSFLCNCLKKYYPNEAEQHIKLFENLKAKTSLEEKDLVEFHYKLVNLYNFFSLRPDMYIDGVLKKIASELAQGDESDSRFKAVYIEILTQTNFPGWLKNQIKNKEDNRWLGMKFMDPEGNLIEVDCGRHDESEGDGDKADYFDQYNPSEPDGKRLDENEYEERWKYFDSYLWHLFYNPDFSGDQRFESAEELPHYFLLVPVFSAAIGEKDYGTILGHLYVTFSTIKELETAFNNKALVNLLWDSWAPLAAQAILHGRENDLLAQPIEHGNDILKDFLSKITYMQDWEKVMVFRQGKWEKPEYCFKRYLGNQKENRQSFENVWDICQPSSENPNGCLDCVNALNDGHANGENSGFKVDGKCYFRFDLKDVLDEKVLPSMDTRDEAEIGDRVLIFQFPVDTFFPLEGSSSHDSHHEAIKKLGEHYRNKMLPVFDRLLLKRKVLQHSTKSAVSAIMSRNHSHHIGSHVTPRTDVEKIRQRLQWLRYAPSSVSNPEWELKVINLLRSRLDAYIQKKAEFMAGVATEPLYTTTAKGFFYQVMLGFIQNTLLMDNIGANEGVNYQLKNGTAENRIRMHCFFKHKAFHATMKGPTWCTCGEEFSEASYPYSGVCRCNSTSEGEVLPELQLCSTPEDEVCVAWPGPLGEYALYCFLENFIRNAVKHNPRAAEDKNKHLNIYINLTELDHEYYTVEIWEDWTNPNKQVPNAEDPGTERVELWKKLKGLLKEKVVDDEGKIRKGAWGLAEMKIMATLLRGSQDFLVMDSNLNVSPKEVKEQDASNGNNKAVTRLVYKFKLMRPKEVAIITRPSFVPNNDDEHKKKGIWWFASIQDYRSYCTNSASPAVFNFVLLDASLCDLSSASNISHLLPYRVLLATDNESVPDAEDFPQAVTINQKMEDLKSKQPEEIINLCWSGWIRGLQEITGYWDTRIELFLQQTREEIPTKKWVESVQQNRGTPLPFSIITTNFFAPVQPAVNQQESHFLFDRHFTGYSKLSSQKNFTAEKLEFHQAFDKGSADFVSLFFSAFSDLMIYELAEAAFLRVLILDERIAEVAVGEMITGGEQGYAKSVYGDPVTRLRVAKKANIFIVTHLSINGGEPLAVHPSAKGINPRICAKCQTFGENGRLKEFKVFWCESSNCNDCEEESNSRNMIKPQAIIIHQGTMDEGVLKCLVRSEKALNEEESLKEFLSALRKLIPFVIVQSGRGIPSQLSGNTKFLPFSVIDEFLMKDRLAKLSLTRLIMTTIRKDRL